VESLLPFALAAFIAASLTYCDLAAVFHTPPSGLLWRPRLKLIAWWWGFILANGVGAGLLFLALRSKDYFKGLDEWLIASLIGAGYSAIVRLKFTTLPNATPLGFEALYEGLKTIVHKRINLIVREWRMEQSQILAQADMGQLRQRALLMVGSDSLLTNEERAKKSTWIEQITGDKDTPEPDRKRILAIFILTDLRNQA